MTGKLNICSMNTQGLGDTSKMRDVLNYIKSKKFNIYCLQDTHFIPKNEKFIRGVWGYECFFSHYTSNSRGVAIFINNNFDFKLESCDKDTA